MQEFTYDEPSPIYPIIIIIIFLYFLNRTFQRSIAGASTGLAALSNKSKSSNSSYKSSKNKRSRRKKTKIEDNDPEAANGFLLSSQNDDDSYPFVSSPNSSPNDNMRGRRRPKDSMAEELV